eukprot:3534340-Rhodomonas_salina.1
MVSNSWKSTSTLAKLPEGGGGGNGRGGRRRTKPREGEMVGKEGGKGEVVSRVCCLELSVKVSG